MKNIIIFKAEFEYVKDVMILKENKEDIQQIKNEFVDYQKLIKKIESSNDICPYLFKIITIYIRDKLLIKLRSITVKFNIYVDKKQT